MNLCIRRRFGIRGLIWCKDFLLQRCVVGRLEDEKRSLVRRVRTVNLYIPEFLSQFRNSSSHFPVLISQFGRTRYISQLAYSIHLSHIPIQL